MKKKILLVLMLILLCGCTKDNYKGEINVLNWSSYIPTEVIESFEKEYNIKVNYGTYSSNEELLAKLSSSKEGTYDVVFPSDYMVELMIQRNMLNEMDKTKFSNYDNINSLFLNQSYDRENKYSLPFLAATTVITVNREYIKDEITGYNDLLNKKYKNNIVLLDDQRIVIGMALLANNYSMNDIDSNHLKVAKKWLLNIKNNTKAYDSDSPKTFLITNETSIGVMWNAEATLANEINSKIEIIYPKEGHAISLDNYVIVKNAKNIDNAYIFINYLLRDDVCQKIINEYPYITTNKNVNNYKEEELEYILKYGSYVKNVGSDISKYDELWADIK